MLSNGWLYDIQLHLCNAHSKTWKYAKYFHFSETFNKQTFHWYYFSSLSFERILSKLFSRGIDNDTRFKSDNRRIVTAYIGAIKWQWMWMCCYSSKVALPFNQRLIFRQGILHGKEAEKIKLEKMLLFKMKYWFSSLFQSFP